MTDPDHETLPLYATVEDEPARRPISRLALGLAVGAAVVNHRRPDGGSGNSSSHSP
jgi:hypothetical protein